MLAILAAVVAYFTWGSGDIFGAISTRKVGTFLTSFWNFLFGFIIFSLYAPFVLKDLNHLTLPILLLNIGLGVLSALTLLCFNQALRIGNASIVGTIAGSFSALVVILSLIFLNESLTIPQAVAIILILFGVVLTSLKLSDLKQKKLFNDKGLYFAVLTMIGWGVYHSFIKLPVREIGWFWPSYISAFTALIFFFTLGIFKRGSFKKIKPKIYIYLILAGGLLTVGEFSYTFGINLGANSIVAPIATSYVTLFVLLSRFVFKDRLNKQQALGIVTTLCGIVILAILS
jgi:bacterial/archaeal transporter family protein